MKKFLSLLTACSLLVPIKLTLRSGQSFQALLTEKTPDTIIYTRRAADGTVLKGSAKRAQVTSILLPTPKDFATLAPQALRRGPRRKRALEKGKELWELYSWHTNWPGHSALPYYQYAILNLNCERIKEAAALFQKALEKGQRKNSAKLLSAFCLHKLDKKRGLEKLLREVPENLEKPEEEALRRYLLGLSLEKERPDLALQNFLYPHFFLSTEKDLACAALLAATALCVREKQKETALRLTIVLTNEYPEAAFHKHRRLALRWLGLTNRYTKAHPINQITTDFLP